MAEIYPFCSIIVQFKCPFFSGISQPRLIPGGLGQEDWPNLGSHRVIRSRSYETHISGSIIIFHSPESCGHKGDDFPKVHHDEPGLGRTGLGRDGIYPDNCMVLNSPDFILRPTMVHSFWGVARTRWISRPPMAQAQGLHRHLIVSRGSSISSELRLSLWASSNVETIRRPRTTCN